MMEYLGVTFFMTILVIVGVMGHEIVKWYVEE